MRQGTLTQNINMIQRYYERAIDTGIIDKALLRKEQFRWRIINHFHSTTDKVKSMEKISFYHFWEAFCCNILYFTFSFQSMFVLGIINHIAGCRTSDKKRSVWQGTSPGEVHSRPRVSEV